MIPLHHPPRLLLYDTHPCRLWHGPLVRDGALERCSSCGRAMPRHRPVEWMLRGAAVVLAAVAVVGVIWGMS
jgi:hypothetical protein